MAKTDLTAERLRELLDYDPETGIFINRISRGKAKNGCQAGSRHHDGYRQICIDGRVYGEHRLAWIYVYSVTPLNDIDHIDGNRSNNAISNLRDVSRSQNLQNQRVCRSDNKSGFLGVSWNQETELWYARIQINKIQKGLGYFKTPEDAHLAYLNAKREIHSTCTI